MPAKLTRKALKVAGLKSYFGSAKKAHLYRAVRRNRTLHLSYIMRKLALANAGRIRHRLQRKRRPDGTHTLPILR